MSCGECGPSRKAGVCGQCGRGTQHGDTGGWPSSSFLKATQIRLPLYDFGILQMVIPLPEPRVIACELDFVFCPFNRMPGFPAAFCHIWIDGILADFHSPMLCGLLFPALDAPCGDKNLTPERGLYSFDILLDAPLPRVGVEPACFSAVSLLLVLKT